MQEIERKYLVQSEDYLRMSTHHRSIRQEYLTSSAETTVRVRIIDQEARLTIKGASHDGGLSRSEWEYPIPLADAEEMLAQCAGDVLTKVRYYVPYEGYLWEVDRFGGELEGLVMAEVELTDPSEEPPLPKWLGREVTGDPRYYNAQLAKRSNPMPPIQ